MKKIIAIMLMMAMLICGCGKAENTTTEPTNATSISAESTKGTDSTPAVTEGTEPTSAPTEPSEAPTDEATEPSSDEATETTEPDAPDPYADIKYYPFPLLDMTVAEIEAEYGELEWSYSINGGNPVVYTIPSFGIEISYIIDTNKYDAKNIPKDVKPYWVWYENATIYPGISVGMTPDQIPDDLKWFNGGIKNTGEGSFGYFAYYNVPETQTITRVEFAIPKHILEEYPPIYGFSSEQLDDLQSWSDSFIYNLYDTAVISIRVYRGSSPIL